MENYGEVCVTDFIRLMEDYLGGRKSIDEYTEEYFALSKRRVNIPDARADQIIQRGYGDADDYDPIVKLPNTILEPELRDRVARSLRELSLLGYALGSKR